MWGMVVTPRPAVLFTVPRFCVFVFRDVSPLTLFRQESETRRVAPGKTCIPHTDRPIQVAQFAGRSPRILDFS
jgi:hypothetical protein